MALSARVVFRGVVGGVGKRVGCKLWKGGVDGGVLLGCKSVGKWAPWAAK